MKQKWTGILIFLILFCSTTFAQEYYADITLDVLNDGSTIISGTTNHPQLQNKTTQEFTSKSGEVWALNLNPQETFSEYIYTIKLPVGAEILDMNLFQNYRLSSEEERIVIIGTGQNAPFFINLKYRITQNPPLENYFPYLIGGMLVIIIIGGYLTFTKNKASPKKTRDQVEFNKDALTERQLQITNYLEKHNGKATQAEIQKATNLPKASLSRNTEGLIRKGIIKKERKGMSMLLYFNEKEKQN